MGSYPLPFVCLYVHVHTHMFLINLSYLELVALTTHNGVSCDVHYCSQLVVILGSLDEMLLDHLVRHLDI